MHLKKELANYTIFFLGTAFKAPVTGGQIYNAHISDRYLQTYPRFYPIDYPWSSPLGNIIFDLKTAYKLIRAPLPKILIFDESLHQRMIITLLISIFTPNVKLVIMLHQLAYTRRTRRWHFMLTRFLDSCMIKYSDLSISAGICVRNQANELVGGKYKSKIRTVFTTVQDKIDNANSKKNRFQILFVGSLVPMKGLEYLIEACEKVQTTSLETLVIHIAGSMEDQKYVSNCKSKIAGLGLTRIFKFHGLLEFTELSSLYRESSLFIFPSLSENMPMSLIEAMSAECVPIAFDNSAMPYIIDHMVNGFLVDNKDVNALARAIDNYFDLDKMQRLKMAKAAKISVEQYVVSWDEVSEKFSDELATIL